MIDLPLTRTPGVPGVRSQPVVSRGWQMIGAGRLISFERPASQPGPGRVLVRVAGCGVCHTDLGFLYGGVPTKRSPVVLGHEISGVVIDVGAGAEMLRGARVVVAAVSPCGTCRSCQTGRPTSCRNSVMPGNDEDGGFATHVEVPASSLCLVDGDARLAEDSPIGAAGLSLWEVSVVADAVATPFQALRRSRLGPGELAIIVGSGGLGIFAIQIARSMGAVVAALDVDPAKLERASQYGAARALDAKKGAKELKAELRDLAKASNLSPEGWHVYEMSGTTAGQELAWSLLTTGGSISVVGFTPQPASLRLSNLMAFDATAYGNWGCDPGLYPYALAKVASGQVKLRGLVRRESLADAPAVLEAVHHGKFSERVVLVP